MAIEEIGVVPARPRTVTPGARPAEGVPRIHDLAPDVVAQVEAILPRPLAPRLPRIATIGGSVASLPLDLLGLVSPGRVVASEGSTSSADVLIICPQDEGEERLGPDLSALERACAAAVAAARRGQTILMTSASYVGCTRDLLVVPLQRRGFVMGESIHVAVSPESVVGPVAGQPSRRLVGAATASCARAAAAILGHAGAVTVAQSLEAAEAASLTSRTRRGPGDVAKRLLDVVGALMSLAILAPVMALIAIAILLDDGRPILFTQERVGLNGHRFKFRKFRTMTKGAEQRLYDVIHLNQIRGPGFQIENDPRVTRIGRFLRASSLDELPQLWNVLVGEMSLVGPRPAPIVEVAAYRPWHLRRLSAKPGITGLAQVRARKYNEFDLKAGIDLQYIDHWSLWLDIEILLRTVPAVLRFTGR